MKKWHWVLLGFAIVAIYVAWGIYVSIQWSEGQVGEIGAFGDSFAFIAGLLNGAAVLAAIYGTALQREDLQHSIDALRDQAVAQRDASRRALDANIVATQRMIVELAELSANLSDDNVDNIMGVLVGAQMVRAPKPDRGMNQGQARQRDRGLVKQFLAHEMRRASSRRDELELERKSSETRSH